MVLSHDFMDLFHKYEVEELIQAYCLQGKDVKEGLLLPEKIKLTIQTVLEQLRLFRHYKSSHCIVLFTIGPHQNVLSALHLQTVTANYFIQTEQHQGI